MARAEAVDTSILSNTIKNLALSKPTENQIKYVRDSLKGLLAREDTNVTVIKLMNKDIVL